MLSTVKSLAGYKLHGLDGEVGKVEAFYFDDHHWTIRYLVADTGSWLTGRQVLISPYALANVNKDEHYIAIDLTKAQIESSPSLNRDKPVSHEYEDLYYGYYGWPMYWDGPAAWGSYPRIERSAKKAHEFKPGKKAGDHHLRNTAVVTGYDIQAADGELGHVDDFIIDDDTWTIHYLVIDTRNWWLGKKVLISPQWIERVSWDESKVFVNLSRDMIKDSPEYNEESLLTRDYEIGLHQHYNRQGYWGDEEKLKQPILLK